MTSRRKFLSQALSLAVSPMMPVSTGQLVAAAVAPLVPASVAVLSAMHVDTVAEMAVSAFDLNCVYELNPFPLFGDMDELRHSSLAELEPYFTHAKFDTLYPLVDALEALPDDMKGYGLDCLAYNIMQIYAQRLTHINHILLYSDQHLQSLKSAQGFKELIDAYHDENDPIWKLKAFGAQELRRDLIVAELELVLKCAIGLADKIAKMREPEWGVPRTGAAYMAALLEWDVTTEFSMPERSDDISSAEFARCLKIWMEKQFVDSRQFRLGLYDVPEGIAAELQAAEDEAAAPGAEADRLLSVKNTLMAEELFGSVAGKETHFAGREVDASLCRLVEHLAETSPGQQARISWDDIDDPATAHFNIRVAGAGAQITQQVFQRLKEMFEGAEIQITEFPAEEGGEEHIFQIAYADSQGEAEIFRRALAEALQDGEREYAEARTAEAAEIGLEPRNLPIPR